MNTTPVSRVAVMIAALLCLPPAPVALASDQATDRAPVVLSAEERAEEDATLRRLGLRVPEGGVLLERPFEPPYTTRSFLVPSSWHVRRTVTDVSAADLARDLDYLEVAFTNVYGGARAAEARGWDFAAWFSEWRAMLASHGDERLSAERAFAPFEALQRHQLDNHSGPLLKIRFGGGSSTSVLSRSPAAACTALRLADGTEIAIDQTSDPARLPRTRWRFDAESASFSAAQYVVTPTRFGHVAAVRSGEEWIPCTPVAEGFDFRARFAAIADLAAADPQRPSARTVEPGIEYVRLPSFSKPNVARMIELARGLKDRSSETEVLVVDLRMNDGGDGEPALGLLSRWLDMRTLARSSRVTTVLRDSPLSRAMRWARHQRSLRAFDGAMPENIRASMQRHLDAVLDGAGGAPRWETTPGAWGYAERDPNPSKDVAGPRVLVLVDRYCGSDGEFIASVLAAHPGTVVAGENTFGVAQFIRPAYFVLPHTRIPFRLAMGASDMYGDGRSMDGFGLDVDVIFETRSEFSAAHVLALARRLATSD